MGFRVMNEEVVYPDDEEDLTYEVYDEALETAAWNEALHAWTHICTGKQCATGCRRRGVALGSGPIS